MEMNIVCGVALETTDTFLKFLNPLLMILKKCSEVTSSYDINDFIVINRNHILSLVKNKKIIILLKRVEIFKICLIFASMNRLPQHSGTDRDLGSLAYSTGHNTTNLINCIQLVLLFNWPQHNKLNQLYTTCTLIQLATTQQT